MDRISEDHSPEPNAWQLRHATEKIDQEFSALKTKAEAAETVGDMARAEHYYTAAAKIRPEIWILLAQRSMALREPGRATKYWARCYNETKHREVKQVCLSNLAVIQYHWGFIDTAEKCCLIGLKMGEQPSLLGNLGLVRMTQLRMAEADELLTRAVNWIPEFEQAIFTRAIVRLTVGDLERGWKDYRHRFKGALAKIVPPSDLLVYTLDS